MQASPFSAKCASLLLMDLFVNKAGKQAYIQTSCIIRLMKKGVHVCKFDFQNN